MADELKSALKRICELQVFYTSLNTPEMQERGSLLRGPVKDAFAALQPILSPALGQFGDDFHVSASDGIGPKTELPWVRFCSERMSPRPTEGFYCVVHFSTDGGAINVTVGCGSSRFFNGYSVVLPNSELDYQTGWARLVIAEAFGSIEPFTDPPNFGASRRLPKSFERATAISKRIPVDEIDETDLNELLVEAAKRLRAVYDAQSVGRNLSPADQEEIEITAVVSPMRGKGARQGFGLTAAARKAVEMRAMALADAWLREQGYSVRDCSSNSPYDLEATKDGVILKVEVKGTTSDRADAILMTRSEVDLHTAERGATALMVVSRIVLTKMDSSYEADGGSLEAIVGWDIRDWLIEPTAFRLTRS